MLRRPKPIEFDRLLTKTARALAGRTGGWVRPVRRDGALDGPSREARLRAGHCPI
jgi:hypothetical protein